MIDAAARTRAAYATHDISERPELVLPAPEKHGMIDGFQSVQAVRRAAERGRPDPPATPPPEAAPSEPAPPDSAAGRQRVAHTTMPTKHTIVCYACTYTFTLTGRLEKVYCPKCRELLECGDIDVHGPWSKDIKTVGQVTIHPDADIAGGTIVATDIVVGGDARKADLRPTRRIELAMAAVTDPAQLMGHDLRIRSDARLAFDGPLRCRDIEIAGELSATLEPSGSVTVAAGAFCRGHIKAAHLVVEEGAGFAVQFDIRPAPTAAPTPAPSPHPAPAAPKRPAPTPQTTGAAPPERAGAKPATPTGTAGGRTAARIDRRAGAVSSSRRHSGGTQRNREPGDDGGDENG